MKKSILISSFIFSLLGFCFNSNLLAQDMFSPALELSEPEETTAVSLTAPPPVCNIPTWPSTSNITQTTATFNWSAASGAMSYSLQTRLPNGTWMDVPGGPFTSTSVTVGGFNPNTTYEWRVRSNCSGGQTSSWTVAVSFTTNTASCSAPSWLYTTNITQTTATFDWSPVSGAISYSIQWRLAGGTWYNLSGGPWTSTWLNVGGFEPGTAYEWRVRSNCYNGVTSPWSNGASFTTLGTTCYTPTGTHTTYITETAAMFNWTPVSGAESYSVQIRLPNGTWSFIPGSPFINTPATVNGLNPGTTYEWRVRANCGYGNHSYWSSPVSFITSGSIACNIPNWLYTTNITQTTVTFHWSSCGGAMSYSVQWRLAGGIWYDLSGGPWTVNWLNVGGFQPGTSYEWRVRSNCPNGVSSPWSIPCSFTTLGATCYTPTGTYTSYITETAAMFNWTPVPGAQSYSVQMRIPNGTWSFVPVSPFINTPVTVNGLNPGTTYEWRVQANCGYGTYSYWTTGVIFTTVGTSSLCNAPTGLLTTNITETTATFNWFPVSGAQSYSLQIRQPNEAWIDVPGGPHTETSITVYGFVPNTTYEWRVRSNCSAGQVSNWTVAIVFTAGGSSSLCNAPAGLSTTNITGTTATFNWSPVSGALSYSLQIRQPNEAWIDVPGGPHTETTITVYGFVPNTTYEWRV